MITYSEERLSDIKPEVEMLIHEHWNEVTGEGPEVDPDWDNFRKLDDLGILHTLTVRSDGVLIGYVILLTAYSLHYKSVLIAQDDAFFVRKEFRKGLVGARIFKEVEAMMSKKGVNRIFYHEKTKAPMGKVFEFLGYRNTERIWMKDL